MWARKARMVPTSEHMNSSAKMVVLSMYHYHNVMYEHVNCSDGEHILWAVQIVVLPHVWACELLGWSGYPEYHLCEMAGVSMEYHAGILYYSACVWDVNHLWGEDTHSLCVSMWTVEMLKVRWALLWLSEQVNCHNFSIMGTGHSLHVMRVNKEPDI